MLFEQGLPGVLTQTDSEEYDGHRNSNTVCWELLVFWPLQNVWSEIHVRGETETENFPS